MWWLCKIICNLYEITTINILKLREHGGTKCDMCEVDFCFIKAYIVKFKIEKGIYGI